MTNKQAQSAEETGAISASESFFMKNQKGILGGVLAVIVIAFGIFAYFHWVAGPREDKASTAIARGQEYFAAQQYDKALNGDGAGFVGFTKIATDFSGTDAANVAKLYTGLSYAHLGKWNEALKALEDYSPADDQMVGPAAIAALGDVYAHANQLDKAVSQFKEAASKADKRAANGKNNSLSPNFLLKAALILENQGKKDDALTIYQDIKKNYVNSMLVQRGEIDKYIERAQAK